MSYSIGERYWVPHEDHAWLAGTLKEFKNAVLEFQTDKGVLKLRVPDLKQKLEPCGSHIDDFVENLVDLDELSEGAILHHIRNRFNRKQIYTHVGSILVAVNPFENLDIYGDRDIRRAQEATNPFPHVFVTAATAYAQLQENRRNQSVLISGESGAGKTETTKKVLAYLANVAPDVKVKSAGEPGMETKILQSNPLLEALGNAKTLRNNNSSRFGKWMKVGFDKQYRIQGCEIVNYLLEKSRVISQSLNERNYHIFYQLLSGSDSVTKERLYLSVPEDYFYLKQSECTTIENVDDAHEFRDTLQAMTTLQFSATTIENIFKILSGILLLGNISFDLLPQGSEYACLSSKGSEFLRKCEDLFGVPSELFTFALVEKKVQMGRGSIVAIKLTPAQAVDNRDTLAKTIYSNLFDYVISRVNATLRTDESNQYSIGILDIFGFEVFDVNSFEQLCINYANEKLQSHFNEIIFNYEKLMYEDEQIPLESIVFEDNSECVGLIENKPYGILTLLEEECSLGNSTDLSYISKLDKTFGSNKPHANKYFVKNKTKPECFTILHFAGGVEYNVTNFLDKNRDNLSMTLKEVMELSQVPLLVELFADKPVDLAVSSGNAGGGSGGGGSSAASAGASSASGGKKTSKATLGIQFRNQLISLITSLRATEPHFIRCIKPNTLKKPLILQGTLALCQMRYAGLFEAIRIRKSGYAYRVSYQSFASTYQLLVPQLMKRRERKEVSDAVACQMILEQVSREGKLSAKSWVVGKKARVFLKNSSDRLVLERERSGKILGYVMRLQKAIRDFLVYVKSQKERMELKRELLRQQEIHRKMVQAAVAVQKVWRGYNVRQMMRSMSNLTELRQVLARREVHKIKDLLARIEQDWQQIASRQEKRSAPPSGTPGRTAHPSSASSSGPAGPTLSPSAVTGPSSSSSGDSKEALIWKMFEHEIKVAKVMLRLLEIQEKFVVELRNALDKQNISELNRLLLKADRLEMSQHPYVSEARDMLLRLHKKRKIMKSLLNFLSNEDEYSDQIIDVIAQAKEYNVDEDFVAKVQNIFNNAGPRLKTRNRLRHAIETCNGYQIEVCVQEVGEIRQHHSLFAEAELRAARAMLRLLYFDAVLFGDKDQDCWTDAARQATTTLAGSSGGGGMGDAGLEALGDAKEKAAASSSATGAGRGGEAEEKPAREHTSPKRLLWGEEPRYKQVSQRVLTPEVIDICNAITDCSFPAIRKMHKLKLIEVAGSLDRVYEVIRYYKWSKLLCTWKYPEITGVTAAASASQSLAESHVASSPQRSRLLGGGDRLEGSAHKFSADRFLSPAADKYGGEDGRQTEDLDDIDALLGHGATGSSVTPNTRFKPLSTSPMHRSPGSHRRLFASQTPSSVGGGGRASPSSPQQIYQRMTNHTTVDNGDGGGDVGQEEFYGLSFIEARSNAFVIRSLHQDFDIFINHESKSASLEAALSSIELSSSMHETLQNLDLMNNIDKKIILPNGSEFKKTRPRHCTLTYDTPGLATGMEATAKMATGGKGLASASTAKLAASQRLASSGTLSASKTAPKAFVGFATAPREKTFRKAAMPQVPMRKVEDLDDSVPEKQLYISRMKKAQELQKFTKEATKDRRANMTRLWK